MQYPKKVIMLKPRPGYIPPKPKQPVVMLKQQLKKRVVTLEPHPKPLVTLEQHPKVKKIITLKPLGYMPPYSIAPVTIEH